ncbi:hypothetical protein BZG36_01278 [Bifiguratus adelaidae]|uniref:Uncharacterized protein n=1 Tax=Bifiguratus adelaidae TaxID=1938954 RepID=A0A261Y599_9FUNG|nr:hypothetical protein BZG36_01278 [Bifiguratus adelaidae]
MQDAKVSNAYSILAVSQDDFSDVDVPAEQIAAENKPKVTPFAGVQDVTPKQRS